MPSNQCLVAMETAGDADLRKPSAHERSSPPTPARWGSGGSRPFDPGRLELEPGIDTTSLLFGAGDCSPQSSLLSLACLD